MANPHLLVPLLGPSASIAAAPPPEMSGVANFAVLVITVLGPAFSVDVEIDNFNVAINLAVTLAACVIFTEVCSFVVVTSDNVRNRLELIKTLLISISIVLIGFGYVILAPNKSHKKYLRLRIDSLLIRPIPAVLIMKCRGSKIVSGDVSVAIWNLLRFIWKHQIGSSVVVSIAFSAAISVIFNHLAGIAVLVWITLFGVLLNMLIDASLREQNPQVISGLP